jgi:hypothetical protein
MVSMLRLRSSYGCNYRSAFCYSSALWEHPGSFKASYEEAVNGVHLVVGPSYRRVFALQMPALASFLELFFSSFPSFLLVN